MATKLTDPASIDLLISEICILFHWFNPSVWLLRQELQNMSCILRKKPLL